MDITLSITGDGGAVRAVESILQSAQAPFGGARGTRALKAIRAAIAEEFSRGAERTDAGFRPWAKSHDFGTRKAANPPLGGTAGRFAKAWAGGAGGFSIITPVAITLGSRLPGAAMHRGDLGDVVTIRPKKTGAQGQPAMRWKLGRSFGVWISARRLREGLKVPARPHARATQALAEIVARSVFGEA